MTADLSTFLGTAIEAFRVRAQYVATVQILSENLLWWMET
jgi:hypothetical protein